MDRFQGNGLAFFQLIGSIKINQIISKSNLNRLGPELEQLATVRTFVFDGPRMIKYQLNRYILWLGLMFRNKTKTNNSSQAREQSHK